MSKRFDIKVNCFDIVCGRGRVKYPFLKPLGKIISAYYAQRFDIITDYVNISIFLMSIVEDLLYEDESSTLDFKRDQYPFSGANNRQKSELLKDIIAFANAWRRSKAYILLGVDEVVGGKSTVVGVSNHLAESNIQQFINSKTNRPIEFSYRAEEIEGQQVGVFEIPNQERPFFLESDYGRLESNVVYLRRGSSTATADPEEIARMGKTIADQEREPNLDVEFADPEEKRSLGVEISVSSIVLDLPERSEIPTLGSGMVSVMKNSNYYREVADYIYEDMLLTEIRLRVRNIGNHVADSPKVVLRTSIDGKLIIKEKAQPWPSRESTGLNPAAVAGINPIGAQTIEVEQSEGDWLITAELDDIQPKADIWSPTFFLGATKDTTATFESTIYGNNISEPEKQELNAVFETESGEITSDKIVEIAKG